MSIGIILYPLICRSERSPGPSGKLEYCRIILMELKLNSYINYHLTLIRDVAGAVVKEAIEDSKGTVIDADGVENWAVPISFLLR